MPSLGDATAINQIVLLLVAVLSPVATFLAFEIRAERKHRWDAADLKAQRDADRLEREQVAATLRLQLEADARQLKHAVETNAQVLRGTVQNDSAQLHQFVRNGIATATERTEIIEQKIDVNTEITRQAAEGAERAYHEANNVNAKIEQQAELARRADTQLTEVTRRFDSLLNRTNATQQEHLDQLRGTSEAIHEVSEDTNARVRVIEENVTNADE